MDRLARRPDLLFCYDTLQFDAVIEALLGRIPERMLASAPGYRAAALAARVSPGLIRASGSSAVGMLLTDLSYQEWEILDAFEYVRHDLREVTFSMGKSGWAYVWPGDDVQEDDWDAEGFQARHLAEYAARCARIGPRLAAGAQTASEGPGCRVSPTPQRGCARESWRTARSPPRAMAVFP
ncbi:gamma-glutamylcyclotransferase family protein [Streptomyces sp. NBC_00453]|uniref:gamma-glutamylcyclotransferase family protein n=1 Tax=Streptomyces sp. NBC_00453 TaxID=2903653 RepID=UPI002E1FC986